jgi:ceramide glucosyltransferase
LNVIVAICAVLTAASAGYCLFCVWAAARFRLGAKDSTAAQPDLPAVSILKPLKGTDPEMYESFRSHCVQDYPKYEIVFGVNRADDPAAALVERLMREFPESSIRLVQCEKKLGANGKVSSLAQLASAANYEFMLVNDSDIRVGRDYLRKVVSELQGTNVGLTTCLYRGVPQQTIGSKLESLGISTDFTPGVLAANALEGGLHFGLGSTLAFRRRELKTIGGFDAIADYLADDYELGKRVSQLGLKVRLSSLVVETFLPAYGVSDFVSHQLRWARTIRASRPGGYAGLVLTYTLPWAISCVVVARGTAWSWLLFAAAVVLRLVMAAVVSISVLRDKSILRLLWLLPLRDLLAPMIWLGGLFGRKIVWRGETFELRDGKLTRAHGSDT